MIERFELENRTVIISENGNLIKNLRKQRNNYQQTSASTETKNNVVFNKLRLSGLFTSKFIAIPKRIGKNPIFSSRLIKELKAKGTRIWLLGDDLKKIEENKKLNLPIAPQKYMLTQLVELEAMGIDGVLRIFQNTLRLIY
ncbi:MAG: hypothetical protein ACJA01_004498, partial [Saprospiraceae bacterium]